MERIPVSQQLADKIAAIVSAFGVDKALQEARARELVGRKNTVMRIGESA